MRRSSRPLPEIHPPEIDVEDGDDRDDPGDPVAGDIDAQREAAKNALKAVQDQALRNFDNAKVTGLGGGPDALAEMQKRLDAMVAKLPRAERQKAEKEASAWTDKIRVGEGP